MQYSLHGKVSAHIRNGSGFMQSPVVFKSFGDAIDVRIILRNISGGTFRNTAETIIETERISLASHGRISRLEGRTLAERDLITCRYTILFGNALRIDFHHAACKITG